MARAIYEVDATIVDANGTFNHVTGYPKRFDSNSYSGDELKALRRAKGEFHSTLGSMYAVDTRQMQTCVLTAADGRIILRESEGAFAPAEPEGDGE